VRCVVLPLLWLAVASHAAGNEPPNDLRREWDISLGALLLVGPAYAGGERVVTRLTPGFHLRYGRLSLSSRGSFRPSTSGAGEGGGARLDLSPSERLRLSLNLRLDSGRPESSSPELQGLGDVRATVRVRLRSSYEFLPSWRASASVHADALGRGGGWAGDLGVGHSLPLSASTSLGIGASYAFGGARYMQAYFGITPQQAAASGYPVYDAHAGARDISVSAGARTELDRHWALFYGASASHLLGPAARSPLARSRDAWGASLGLVHHF
jgi:outer membrane scaffolding protein for murein synthesis (MipA/OmpV family)